MKKLLISLSSFTLVAGASLTVISCKTSSNREFNLLREKLNQIKGSYDAYGNPLTKSGSSVVYIGAKDNGSSQSFLSTIKQLYGDEDTAARELGRPFETVTRSAETSFDPSSGILNADNLSIANLSVSDSSDLIKLGNYVQLTLNQIKFDATIIDGTNKNVSLQVLNVDREGFLQTLKDAFANAQKNKNAIIKAYKIEQLEQHNQILSRSEFYNQWVAGYQSYWLESPNADRSVLDVKMQLRAKSNYYGAILEQNSQNPAYGIRSKGSLELYAPITVGLDYAQPKLLFQSFMFDNVGDYWKSDFFTRFSDFLTEDVLYQLGANAALTRTDNGSEANDKHLREIKERVDKANNVIKKIKEVKGPMFLFFKNGHIVDIRRGWNRYNEFGGEENNKLAKNDYYDDLLSWAKELGSVWSRSAVDHFNEILSNEKGVKSWDFITSDDEGAANWDPKTELPILK